MSTLKDISKQTWTGTNKIEEINAGSFQRIADATEKMASSYDALREERDRWKRWAEDYHQRIKRLERSRSALRGVITRIKHEKVQSA